MFLLAGCGEGKSLGALPGHWAGRLVLEESPGVVTVAPFVSLDSGGGFLVTDAKEAQVRRYDARGHLLGALGRRGKGPGEFQVPVWAARIPSGGLLVTDVAQGMTVFDSAGRFVDRTAPPPYPIFRAVPLEDSVWLLLGRALGSERSPLLHVWRRGGSAFTAQFFATPGSEDVLRAASHMGQVTADVRGDTIVAAFSLVDTLYFFSVRGQLLATMPLGASHFVRLRGTLPRDGGRSARREWVGRVSRIADVFWLADGRLLVQYVNREGLEEHWRLVFLDRRGRRLAEVVDSPRLMVIRGNLLFFADPKHEEPNAWRIWELAL